ncbi:MAG: hypothetical protein IKN52_09910, partial [Victivallales bacterium]|nr:hypothetical protein [Victivallales bacterium]
NIGDMPVDKFAVEYAKAVRVAQLAAWNNNPDLRIYVSMEHHWTMGDPKSGRMVPGRLFLEHFNHVVKEGGDIPWNLAHHPYPENLFNPRFWNDRTAKPNFDTPRITFRNIDQLVKFFKQKEWRYHDKMRDIALTEQGVNYEDNKPDAELAQAAAYAYAYKKIKALPEISAFILHRHVDHAQEGGLHLGLRFNKEGTIASAGKKRMVWDVFKAAGTPDEDKAFQFALKFIGLKSWKDKPAEPEEPKSIFAFDKKDLVYDFRDNMSEAIANRNSLDTRQNEVIRAAGWLVKTIFQHPPRDPQGWSELSFKVKLPEVKRKKLILAWESMVGNDASSGVAFHVLVNGKEAWKAVCKPRQAPTAGEIDLTLFAGKEVVVTFGTNSAGDLAGDWANWIQPTIYKR